MDFSPVLISIRTASVSIIITFFLGLISAYGMTVLKEGPLKFIIDGILIMPQVLPPTVAGFILLCIFGVKHPIGKFFLNIFGIKITFSWIATVIASVVISFPLMYRSARGAFEQVDRNLIDAGRTLGMSNTSIFIKVILPCAWPGVISGGILSFSRGLGEFGATAMIAGNISGITRTLPLAIYSETAAGNMENATIYTSIIVVIALAAVIGLNYIMYRNGKRVKKYEH